MKKALIIILIVLLIVLIILFINGICCDNNITVKNYKVKNTKSNAKLRFVIVSDLHNKEFGKNNIDLLNIIKEQKPDFIAVCGDMIVRENTDTSVMEAVLPELAKIAPTYCCLGNHELDMLEVFGRESLTKKINDTGALLLDNLSIKFKKDNQSIIIGGLSDYPYYEYNYPDYDVPERYFWDEFCEKSKNDFSVLLHHPPEYISSNISQTDIDLLVCGHTHGGQIQIPFIGGLVAPNQGLFPKYDKGEYKLNKTKMIVCAGLGNNTIIPRINNPVEICVVDII